MSDYGLPYMGSKSQIAEDIISFLPSGKRFVDLFGGGFAMSHCALVSHKYQKVYYSDLNPLLPRLVKDAINGSISWAWVSREQFFKQRDTDGLVKYVWSYGNNGLDYMYGRDIEAFKKQCHEFCTEGKPIDGIDVIMPVSLIGYTISDRLDALNKTLASIVERDSHFERWARPESINRLKRIARLTSLQSEIGKLEICCSSYEDYEYQDGDVVYCDPPYKGARGYEETRKVFDSDKFFEWAATRPYKVYVSHYPVEGTKLKKVWSINKAQLLSPLCKHTVEECIYSNGGKECE